MGNQVEQLHGGLAELLTRSTSAQAEAVAAVLGEDQWTYADLETRAGQLATVLRQGGVKAEDRVLLSIPNSLEFLACYFGVLRLGAIAVPVNPLLSSAEVKHCLDDSGAVLALASASSATVVEDAVDELNTSVVVVDDIFIRNLPAVAGAAAVPRSSEDTAVIIYTSGTTGSPKGAQLTHGNALANIDAAATIFGLDHESVVFGGLPLFHVFGQMCALNATCAYGGKLVLMSRFDPAEALAAMERERVGVFIGVPTMYSSLLKDSAADSFDSSALRIAASGGAALPVEVLQNFERRFDCVVLEGYGMSELSPVVAFNRMDGPRLPGSVGLPIAGVEVRIVDLRGLEAEVGEVGEIQVRGHNVMKGYWRRPEATQEAIGPDGWFKTGDLGRLDEGHNLWIVDRKKDLIIRGGYNIYPREVEEVLYQHPAVGEAAVIGIPHEELGEDVAAAVVLKPGEQVSSDQLRQFVRERVAPYKYPRLVWFVDKLPTGPTGKVLKREIVPPVEHAG